MNGSQRFTTGFNFLEQQPPEFVTASTYDTVLSTRSASIRLILSHARETYLKNDVYTTHSGTWSFGQCRGLLQSIPQPVC